MSHDVSMLSFASLFAFIGGRHVINDLYAHRPDILCNPFVKMVILFSIFYMNIKDVNVSIVLFGLYVVYVSRYIDRCTTPQVAPPATQAKVPS